MKVLGDFYKITSNQEFRASQGNYLILAVPVPEGACSEDLSIVSLSPSEMIIAYAPEEDDSIRWDILDGAYDPESGFFGTIIPYVGTAPLAFALVEGTSYSRSTEMGQAKPSGFDVKCMRILEPCFPLHIAATEKALDQIYEIYVEDLGFGELLLRPSEVLEFTLFPPSVSTGLRYRYELRFSFKKNGIYNSATQIAYTAYPGFPSSPDQRITRHEFFHSLQFGYDEFFRNSKELVFGVVEGTAVAAELSLGGLTRSNSVIVGRNPLPVDYALFSNTAAISDWATTRDYETQDFWVYVGKRMDSENPQVKFLIPLFSKGGLIEDINKMLVEEGTFQSLGDAYWQWARNHSFEKLVILGVDADGRTVPHGKPCEWSGHGHLHTVSISPKTDVWEDVTSSFSLEPLSSRVYEIIMDPADWGYSAIATVQSDSLDIQSKFYDHEMIDCRDDNCENSFRTFTIDEETVSAYALISNTSMDSSSAATLRISLYTVPVLEKISGPNGIINETGSTFTWSGSDSDGTITKYQYRKDGVSWIDHGMNTSYTWSGYSEGAHTFEVRAQDNVGVFSEPVIWSFTYVSEDLEITFACPNFEQVVREVIGKPTGAIYKDDVSDVAILSAVERGITDISGIEHFVSLEYLDFDYNSVSDISVLVENAGIAAGDVVVMRYNYLDLSHGSQNMNDIDELIGRGVSVWYEPQREP